MNSREASFLHRLTGWSGRHHDDVIAFSCSWLCKNPLAHISVLIAVNWLLSQVGLWRSTFHGVSLLHVWSCLHKKSQTAYPSFVSVVVSVGSGCYTTSFWWLPWWQNTPWKHTRTLTSGLLDIHSWKGKVKINDSSCELWGTILVQRSRFSVIKDASFAQANLPKTHFSKGE